MQNSVLFSLNSVHNGNTINNSIHHGYCMKEFPSTCTTMRVRLRDQKQNLVESTFLYGLEWKIWHVRNPYIFNCKEDNFRLKSSFFVVAVGINFRILNKFISEWVTRLYVQITICLCAFRCGFTKKWFCCDNSRANQFRLWSSLHFAVKRLVCH